MNYTPEEKSKAVISLSDYILYPSRVNPLNDFKSFLWTLQRTEDILLLEDFLLSPRFLKEPMDILDKIKLSCEALSKFKIRKDISNLKENAQLKYKNHLSIKNSSGKIITRVVIDVCDQRLEDLANSKDFIFS